MKREYTNMVRHSNGTFSGIHSTTVYEEIYIFKESQFNITGYFKAGHEELIELLFLSYTKRGVVVRRIFEDCTFSFTDFTRQEIDDVMHKLTRQKRPSRLRYSFKNCRVLSDNVELENYPLREDEASTVLIDSLKRNKKQEGTYTNVRIHYNLEEMTYFSPKEPPNFCSEYHNHMKKRRLAKQERRKLLLALDSL